MSNFHPLEVVGRGSETQLQAGENLNYYWLILYIKVLKWAGFNLTLQLLKQFPS